MKYKTPTVCAAFAAALSMFDVTFEYATTEDKNLLIAGDTTKLGSWE